MSRNGAFSPTIVVVAIADSGIARIGVVGAVGPIGARAARRVAVRAAKSWQKTLFTTYALHSRPGERNIRQGENDIGAKWTVVV